MFEKEEGTFKDGSKGRKNYSTIPREGHMGIERGKHSL